MKIEADIHIGYVYGSSGLYTGTGASGSIPSTSAPYGNYTYSYYYPSGTAPYSTGSSSTSVDPNTTTTSYYGTVSGGPYKTRNSSYSVDPTGGSTDPPYPYPTGTIGTTGATVASTGDPSTKTIASTGASSGSGKLTYTAPTGIPAEYFFHHKKPKRNVSRVSILSYAESDDRYTDRLPQGFYRGLGYRP